MRPISCVAASPLTTMQIVTRRAGEDADAVGDDVGEELRRLQQCGLSPNLFRFAGGHTIDAGLLAKIAEY